MGVLTQCGLVTPYGDNDVGQQWLRYNGVLADGTKPLPEPMLTGDDWRPSLCIFTQKNIQVNIIMN